MARPSITSRPAFIEAALNFIDQHGVDALSLRTLGQQMQISHATIYRHFGSKDELINALIDDQLGAAISDADLTLEPKERLRNLAIQLRSHFDQHPNLLRPWINGTGEGKNAFEITAITLGAIKDLGISDQRYSRWLRVLENFVIGSMVYDYAAAPNHLSIRANRLRHLHQVGFLPENLSSDQVAAENKAAFEQTLEFLLNQLVKEGQSAV